MNVAAEDSLRRSESALRPSLDDVLVGDGALLLRRAADILCEVEASKASKETRRRSEIKQTALNQRKGRRRARQNSKEQDGHYL